MNNNISNNMNNNMNNVMNNNINNNSKNLFTIILMLLFNIILKPFTTIKEGLSKFENIKNSFILSVIISGFATIFNLIYTMYNTVRVTSYFSDTSWEFSNLKYIDYVEVIGLNFLIYLVFAFAIAGVFYIATLIVKKQVNFSKMVSICSLSIVPSIIGFFVLSPILVLISESIAVLFAFICLIYSFIICYEGINYELDLDGNSKFFVNFGSLSVLFVIVYLLILNSVI